MYKSMVVSFALSRRRQAPGDLSFGGAFPMCCVLQTMGIGDWGWVIYFSTAVTKYHSAKTSYLIFCTQNTAVASDQSCTTVARKTTSPSRKHPRVYHSILVSIHSLPRRRYQQQKQHWQQQQWQTCQPKRSQPKHLVRQQ